MINGHGDNGAEYGGLVKMDFSSNVYVGLQPEGLKTYLQQQIDVLDHYPQDSEAVRLRLADLHGVPPECVLLTNGATEGIYLVAHALSRRGRHAIVQPTFSEYADACRVHGVMPDNVSALDEAVAADVVWLCCPNNPTGSCLSAATICEWSQRHARQLMVIDQSYASLCTVEPLSAREALARGNIILLRSMTKRFAMPGLRLGYIIAPPSVARALWSLMMPWNVNALALRAATYVMEHGHTKAKISQYLDEAQRLRSQLTHVPGVDVWPTTTNFMLLNIGDADCAELCQRLVERHGILIRKADNFWGLNRHFIRVAAQAPNANDCLVTALKEELAGGNQ